MKECDALIRDPRFTPENSEYWRREYAERYAADKTPEQFAKSIGLTSSDPELAAFVLQSLLPNAKKRGY